MAYHIVLSRPTDLAAISAAAREGLQPRHSMAVLAEALDATVHDGSGIVPGLADKVLARLSRTKPLWWAMARDLRGRVSAGDVIFCTGEDIGFPVGALCGGLAGVQVAVMVHHVDSAKKRAAIALFGLRRKVALFCSVATLQDAFLREGLRLPSSQVLFVTDQTDTDFFSPGPASPDKVRPVIASVGLERRDYGTLARATAELDVDVRISGFSADTRVLDRAFPEAMPANMSRRFYSWPELRQLYRDADIVVVSVFPNRYAAGVQGLMEGLSSGSAVVVGATEGLAGYLDDDAMRQVIPGDAAQMRARIVELLADTAMRDRLAERARARATERYRCERYVETLATALRGLAQQVRN